MLSHQHQWLKGFSHTLAGFSFEDDSNGCASSSPSSLLSTPPSSMTAGRLSLVAASASLSSPLLSSSSTSTTSFNQQHLLRDPSQDGLDGYSAQYDLEPESEAVNGLPILAEKKDGLAQQPTRHKHAGQTGKLSRLLMKVNCHSTILPTLRQWILDGNFLPKNMVVVAITTLKREHRYKQALEVADYVWKERLFEMNEYDHTYRLYLTGQVGSIEDVEKCFAGIPSEWMTEMVYNQLISAYISRDIVAEAEAVLEKLKSSGQLVSALPYNQFMAHYRHKRQPGKALQVLEEMKAAKIKPNIRTYNILLSLVLKADGVDMGLELFNTMKKSGIAPDVVTYSMVAKAYIAAGMVEEVGSLVTEMKKVGPDKCRLTHDLLLSIYAEQGNYEELKKLWKSLSRYSNLSARSYGVMIESLGKLGLVREAEQLASQAERKKGNLGARVSNALMYVYARHGKMQDADTLMTRIRKDRMRVSSVTYMHLITGYLKIGKLDEALKYLKTSRECLTYDHSKPWFESFLLVLGNIADRGDIKTAELVFEVFTAEGPYRSTIAYNILLKAYLKARKPAANFVQRMSRDGLQPDAETMAILSEIEGMVPVGSID